MIIYGPHPNSLFFLEAVRTKAEDTLLFIFLNTDLLGLFPAAESTLVVYLRMFGLYFVIEKGIINA